MCSMPHQWVLRDSVGPVGRSVGFNRLSNRGRVVPSSAVSTASEPRTPDSIDPQAQRTRQHGGVTNRPYRRWPALCCRVPELVSSTPAGRSGRPDRRTPLAACPSPETPQRPLRPPSPGLVELIDTHRCLRGQAAGHHVSPTSVRNRLREVRSRVADRPTVWFGPHLDRGRMRNDHKRCEPVRGENPRGTRVSTESPR